MYACQVAVTGIALVSLVGCTESVAPPAGDSYVLRSIAGEAVPAVFRDGDFSTLHILADTLYLARDGTGRETQQFESFDKTDGSLETFTAVTSLEFTVRGNRLEIAYECADTSSCMPPPHLAGVVTESGVEFDVSLGRVPLIFERLTGS